MKVIGNHVIIKKIEESITTSSGILLSSEDKKDVRYLRGKVIGSGDLVKGLKPGDVIHYDTRNSFTVIVHDDPLTVINQGSVVLVE